MERERTVIHLQLIETDEHHYFGSVANMFEYGSSKKNYPKHPFFRKSFKKEQIMQAMKEAQKKLSGGLLDE